MTDYPPSLVRRALQQFGVQHIHGPDIETPADWYSHGATEKIAALPVLSNGGLHTPATLDSFCQRLGSCGDDNLTAERLLHRCAEVHARDRAVAPSTGEAVGC